MDEQTGPPESTTALLRAVLALAADLDPTSLLERFVQAATELTGARYGAINILDEYGASTTFVQSGMPDAVVAALAHPPHAVGVLGQIPAFGVLRLTDLRQHPAFRGLPAGHPPMGSFLGTAVRVRREVFGYLYLSEKDGGFVDVDESLVTALAAAAAVAIQNAELYTAARHRENWLRAGQRITTMLLEGVEEEEVLLQIAASAREIARADTAALVLPGVGGELVMEIVDGHREDKLLGLTMDRDGRSWEAFLRGAGTLVASLSTADTPQLEPLSRFGPALYTPLRAGEQSVGVLVLLRRAGSPPFAPSDLTMAQSFAAQAALALILAQARHTQDVGALLDERERIARDLHDLAIQQLFATGMQLETARGQVALGDASTAIGAILEEALAGLESSVRQIRVIVRTLHDQGRPSTLVERLHREITLARPGLGFAALLRIEVDGRAVSAADGDLAGRIDDVVGPDRAEDIIAVVREGLANAARHARSTAVTVRVTLTGSGPNGAVLIEVEDNGAGLDLTRDRHSGTKNLADRAQRERGTFTLGPVPSGPGTLLSWQAPLG
ncbi:GAF domain-containing protein [Pengzhenrongella frigida]|uniref:GAF domain-containing protein n=1 Tax=Pengzhenrongella frigida TaxID=1259133 RepID=A0A4Q5N7E3_9MICO|nr:GAF domain-containing protein [Cellulomonas sp. HLT2-17]